MAEQTDTVQSKRIIFDESCQTFRLHAGNSLYAFSISPELFLEHLYWGEYLQEGFDLRYLTRSSRMVHFSTAELWENREDDVKASLVNQTLEEIKETWKKNFSATSSHDPQEIQNRRKEYLSWRLMSKCLLPTQKSTKSQLDVLNRESFPISNEADPFMTCPINDEESLPFPIIQPTLHKCSSKLRLLDPGKCSPESKRCSLPSRFSTSSLLPDSESKYRIDTLPVPASFGDLSSLQEKFGSKINLLAFDTSPRTEGAGLFPEEEDLSDDHIQTRTVSFASAVSPPRGMDNTFVTNVPGKTIGNRPKFGRPGGMFGKGTINLEYADNGTGDFRSPSFIALDLRNPSNRHRSFMDKDGMQDYELSCETSESGSSGLGISSLSSTITPLRYNSHAIFDSFKPPMPDNLPGVRPISRSRLESGPVLNGDHDCSTLVVTLVDEVSGLEVDLIYVVMHHFDVITRRAVFRNCDGLSPKMILKASSLTLDVESVSLPFHMIKLSGSWGRERSVIESPLTSGVHSFGSLRGVSGHVHNPFLALSVGPFSEDNGDVLAFSMMYSGNYLMEAEVCESGRLRVNAGINPMVQWHLKPGHSFNTPECVMVRSSQGLGGISIEMHRFIREHVMPLPPQWTRSCTPILLNTWEACYFKINEELVLQMAKDAVKVGVNLLVIDDGWFGKREDISSSLGDWVPNKAKFPRGLGPLASDLNAMGCRLGLWLEPEMASLNSRLLREHPEWYLGMPELPKSVGRNQMVLDMSRSEVRNYLFTSISKLLSTVSIDYIKWDMNRPLTEVFSSRFIPSPGFFIGAEDTECFEEVVFQAETSHRYMLGVYDLLSRLRAEFPDLLIETCASGGGRFDLGMLYFSHQIWCSDNTDAIARMRIQYGTSIPYPLCCIGSHVSTAPNHITGNVTRLRTRGFVAMSGTFGFELDLGSSGSMTSDQRELCKKQVDIFKLISPIINDGDFYRLWNPFQSSFAAWMSVSPDKSRAAVFAFSLNSDHWSNLAPRLTLKGLLPEAEYEVSEPIPNNVTQSSSGSLQLVETKAPFYQLGYPCVVLTGAILMKAGLPLKFHSLDDSHLFLLTRVLPDPAEFSLPVIE